jgi:hypothetical protein
MQSNSDAVAQLQALAGADNFAADGALYAGVHDLAQREKLNSQFDATTLKFISAVERHSTEQEYVALLSSEIAHFPRDELETEDAEQLAGNFERIMDRIGLESSDGILNTWMYGFDPSKL